MIQDVPISMDFREQEVAVKWAEAAMAVRPWRAEFFDAFAREIASASVGRPCRILELGSGPGFLAERILGSCPAVSYLAVDFSAAMHELARQRLSAFTERVQLVERNLRDEGWSEGLGEFDFAVTHQAVHELRHKRYAQALHEQVRECLRRAGTYLVCDHFLGEGGMSNGQLYMTVQEQRDALLSSGFSKVEQVLLKGGLVLHRAT
jgi:SAM-dependent methyltransferase